MAGAGGCDIATPSPPHVREALNVNALRAALCGLVSRHEALRTSFGSAHGGAPFQDRSGASRLAGACGPGRTREWTGDKP